MHNGIRPIIEESGIPGTSVLERSLVEAAWFRDAYRVPLRRPQTGVVDVFLGIFGHRPWWMKAILIVRNRIASFCGLDAASASEILHSESRLGYRVGDKIGAWPIFHLSDNELVAGRNNKHLDFRLSVLKVEEGGAASVVISTVCTVHNLSGKVYLFFIAPFHKWGVKRLMLDAIVAGRL